MKKILVVGATSAIAEATARLWAQEGQRLYLLARNGERLQTIANDLKLRGAESVQYQLLDMNDLDRHEAAIDAAYQAMTGIDIVLIAHGTLGEQKACEQDFKLALQELNNNAISVFSFLTHLANRFEARRQGTIAVISSVAGDRGRQSNYVYGTAKGAVTIFLQGLRQRLYKAGVHVVTIKPGFVDTPMTNAFKKGVLWSRPETIAQGIVRAIRRQADVVYVPLFWRPVMAMIRSIPEKLFKHLTL